MVVTYSAHAQQKLLMRKVRREDVERVIANPTEVYEDTEHNAMVAFGFLDDRTLIVAYQRLGKDMKVITVYNTTKIDKLVSSKTRRGAWRRIR